MIEKVATGGGAESDAVSHFDREKAIRRYQQIQQEIARLDEERECLRDMLFCAVCT